LTRWGTQGGIGAGERLRNDRFSRTTSSPATSELTPAVRVDRARLAVHRLFGLGDVDQRHSVCPTSVGSRPLRTTVSTASGTDRDGCRALPTTPPFLVRPLGFEPRTCGLRVRCSAVELEARGHQTSRAYSGGPASVFGAVEGDRRGSNPRPPGPHPGALPTELRPPRSL
jgi:hypothetical protein